MKQTLVFQAPIASRSGYGDHSRDLLYSLYKLDKFNIKIINTRWGDTPMDAIDFDNPFHKWIVDNIIGRVEEKPDVYVQVTVPNEFQPLGFYNIGITAGIETTMAHHEWLIGCNKMDLIIVPSLHSKNTIVGIEYEQRNQQQQVLGKLKMTKPCEILFEGYDENVFNDTNIVEVENIDKIKEDFCFLFVGHWLKGDFGYDRKNIGMLLKSFSIAFKNQTPQPALILKTSSATMSLRDREMTIKRIKEALGKDYGTVPVYLLHGDLSVDEMNSLYRHEKIKAMINFTHGEGFGRPLLEFSVTGKPILVSNWSGHLDFLKEGAVLLEGQMEKVHDSATDNFIIKGSSWFSVNISKALPKMRDMYNNYDNYLDGSKKLAEHNMANFTLSKMTEEFDKILTKYDVYSKVQPKFQQLELPELKMIN